MALLTTHFTEAELGADDVTATPLIRSNLLTTARWLEWYRAALGTALRVTSGYRTPGQNVAAGGVPTSDHMVGLAADVVPLGMTLWTAHQKFVAAREAGQVPTFDQLVYYPADGHIHVGLGSRNRREVRIKALEGSGYPLLTDELLPSLRRVLPGRP